MAEQTSPTKQDQKPGLLQRIQDLPPQGKVVLGVGVLVFAYLLFFRGGDETLQQNSGGVTTSPDALTQQEQTFRGLQTDTPELLRSFFDQNERDLADLRDQVENKLGQQDQAVSQAITQNAQLQQNMRQILEDFKSEIQAMQARDRQDREVLSQLAEETRKLQLNGSSGGIGVQGRQPQDRPRRPISQNIIGITGGVDVNNGSNQALLGGIVNAVENRGSGNDFRTVGDGANPNEKPEPLPFVPPLGFVKATLINGVDALVGGTATPALAKLHGKYRTPGNAVVNLESCYTLIEFSGEISTERAVGKPSQVTCVYPDSGVASYSVSGYVVDALDGIIGIPGVFYEGDASRLAAAILADFSAGLTDIVVQNQTTSVVNDEGTTTSTLTGDEARAEIAGGVGNAVSSLRDYLFERANRVVPFVRIDATRTLHIVFLSGIELRPQGKAWSRVFDAQSFEREGP